MNEHERKHDTANGPVDKSTQNKATAAVLVIIALLFLFSAFQTGLLHSIGCLPIGGSSAISESDVASLSDTPVDISDSMASDSSVSDGDVSASDAVVIYYPEVHIDGITLPEGYGAGLFDAEAAMWLINEYRRQNGIYELLPGEFGLEQVSRIRLGEAIESFSHSRPDGSEFSSAYSQTGLEFHHCAENLAVGQYTAEEVVRDWIESETHRANLLSESVTYMCVMTDMNDEDRAVWVFEAYSPMP